MVFVVKVYVKESDGILVCPLCETEFIWVLDYIEHMKKVHPNDHPHYVYKLYDIPKPRKLNKHVKVERNA